MQVENTKKYHKLDSLFGPTGIIAGWIIMGAGLVAMYNDFSALLLILLGAFVTFTHNGSQMDAVNRRVRFVNRFFGIFPVGGWITLMPDMRLGIRQSDQVARTYSRSNRMLQTTQSDYRITLFDVHQRPLLALMKFKNLDEAQKALPDVCKLLGLGSML